MAPQGYFYSGPFGLLGEYALSRQEVRRGASQSQSWSTRPGRRTGSFFLTGEKASFTSVTPKKVFDPAEPAARRPRAGGAVRRARLDDDAVPVFANAVELDQQGQGLGGRPELVPDQGLKVMVDYEHTTFDGGAATAATARPRTSSSPVPDLVLIQ